MRRAWDWSCSSGRRDEQREVCHERAPEGSPVVRHLSIVAPNQGGDPAEPVGPLPEDDVSDDELIAAVLVGELAAIDVLYERHAHVVFALIVRILGDREEAEDLCKRSFSARGNRLIPDESRGSVRGWIHGIAHHLANQLRHRRRRPQPSERATSSDSDGVDKYAGCVDLGSGGGRLVRSPNAGLLRVRSTAIWAARGSRAVCGRVQPIRNRRQLE